MIKIKKSSVTGVIPTGLAPGELAINIKDKKLFFLDSLGVIQSFDLFATKLTLKSLESYVFSNAAYPLVSQTSLQKLFNASTLGALNVAANTSYFFECQFTLSAMSAVLGNFGFGFLGTAGIANMSYTALSDKADTLGTPSTAELVVATVQSAVVLVSNSAITTGNAIIRGIIRVNTAGTLIPSVSLSIAALAFVGSNSWFRAVPIGVVSDKTNGDWV
ncbi:hypothetical protein [Flavobacterium sp. LB2P53]|uniref:hypothetical protein n=1 Tax=Flavobacterium sp. LB2P53 TaxID=2497481 RepID=UPI00131537DD|nr:hypothetical protein [Flavobacterium sp. LB2P53]